MFKSNIETSILFKMLKYVKEFFKLIKIDHYDL